MNNKNGVPSQESKVIIDHSNPESSKQFQVGRKIVLTIAITNVILAIITSFVGSWNILRIIVQISLSLALYNGIKWVWGLFTLSSFVSALTVPFMLLNLVSKNLISSPLIYIWFAMCFTFAALSFKFLAYNKSVAYFFNNQRN